VTIDAAREIDAAVVRLFTLLGIPVPAFGSVTLEFHDGTVHNVRPMTVIRIRGSKGLDTKKNLQG
jgi:hypothetical protein